MKESSLSIFSGIAQGLEKAATNLQNISMKKEELRVEREKYAQDKKIKDAQLKKLEIDTSPEAIADLRETHNAEMKAKKAAFDLSQMKISTAEINEKKKEIELNKTADIIAASYTGDDPFLQQLAISAQNKTGLSSMEAKEEHYGGAEGSQAKPRIPTQSGMQTTAVVDGQIVPTKPYDNRGTSAPTQKVLDSLGAYPTYRNFKKALAKNYSKFQAAGVDMDILDQEARRRYGVGSDFYRSDFLPEGLYSAIQQGNVKRTSEAVDYIMRQHGKTEEEAKEILNEMQGK